MNLASRVRRGDGRVLAEQSVANYSTYRVGGTARFVVTLSTLSDALELLPEVVRESVPYVVIGNGSNVLFNDGGLELTVVRLAGEFEEMATRRERGRIFVEAGAALNLPVMARRLDAVGAEGFAWAVGVPGTVGGAVAMNAGGHGSDTAASVREIATWSNGAVRIWSRDELAMAYRHSALGNDDVVLAARFELATAPPGSTTAELREIVRWRREHQPGGANGGSTFRNPPSTSAGALLESVGLRGYRQGTARFSEKHANFIIADDGGRAADVFALMREGRRRVALETGISLELENRLVGFGEAP